MAVTPSASWRTTAATAAALSTAILPFFLLGAMSLSIQEELGLTETAIGLLGTVMFLSSSITATPAGLLVERIGASLALRTGVVLSCLASAGIGLLAEAWWQLAVPMVLVGFGVALIDTGGARAFADRVRVARQGLAFGIKEASIPAASMLAGVSLPTIAAWFGWRAGFVAAVVVGVAVWLFVPSRAALGRKPDVAPAPEGPRARIAVPGILRFATGVALGTGAATGGTVFLVPALVDRGFEEGSAGLVLAVASVASITMRLSAGWVADREGASPVAVLAVMMLTGAGAALVLASAAPRTVLAGGAIVLLGAGWGWTGLAFLAVVRARPGTAAAAAGVVLTGLGAGGSLGPLAFGAVAEGLSFPVAWLLVAGAMTAAGLFVRSARQHLEVAARAAPPPAPG